MNTPQERIAAAANVVGKSLEGTFQDFAAVTKTFHEPELSTNGDATAISLSIALLADRHLDKRMDNLSAHNSGSDALRFAAAKRGSRLLRIERGIGPSGFPTHGLAGVFSTVQFLEPGKLADDLAVAQASGIRPSAVEVLAREAERLGITATTPRVTVHASPQGEDMQIELGAPARDLWTRLGDGGEPGRFLRALAPRGAQLIWFGASPRGLLPWHRLEILQPDLAEAVAIAGKFGDMNRLQAFVAALEARSIASVSVMLGAHPLGGAWLTATV